MICKYTASRYFDFACPVYTGFTGVVPTYAYGDLSYTIQNQNANVSGSGYYQSYVNSCDANARAEEIAYGTISYTGCLYEVEIHLQGDCDIGMPYLTYDIYVAKTGNDPYTVYLQAYIEATGLISGACTSG
jgi:hypothetical protein